MNSLGPESGRLEDECCRQEHRVPSRRPDERTRDRRSNPTSGGSGLSGQAPPDDVLLANGQQHVDAEVEDKSRWEAEHDERKEGEPSGALVTQASAGSAAIV